MAAEFNWHNYGAKLRHCHPVCTSRGGCGPSGPCNDGDHFVEIFLQNCSLSIALTSADQKPQKSLKRWQAYYSSIITLPECQRDKLWQISQTFGGRERGVDSARREGSKMPSPIDKASHDTIRDAILTCARKPTWVSLIYRTEQTTKRCKNRKTKS